MAEVIGGPVAWRAERDKDGHRTYKIAHRVKALPTEGPAAVMTATGLPAIGDTWHFGSDIDLWAFCWPEMNVTIDHPRTGDPCRYYIVEQTFSTKPLQRCQDTRIENPLDEPQKVSGTFTKHSEEMTKDADGRSIIDLHPCHEQLRGAEIEIDHSLPTVRIEQNVLDLELSLICSMIDHVNMNPLWGLPKRTIKLTNVAWEKKLYGVCTYYYTRIFDFNIDFKTFDRDILATASKVLKGHFDMNPDSPYFGKYVVEAVGADTPDPSNIEHFIRYKDQHGENTTVVVDRHGLPANTALEPGTGTEDLPEIIVGLPCGGRPYIIHLKKYKEADFLELGIPTEL